MASPLQWSVEMDDLFWNCVGRVIRDDPRTDWSEHLSLGYPFELIREQVLRVGLADFSQGYDHPQYGRLTAEEKVSLYCFINFKKHFFAAWATFENHRPLLENVFSGGGKPVVIDIGCGPATVGLALAQSHAGKSFDYVGVDSAEPMKAKAFELWQAAQAKGLIGEHSTATFRHSWTEIAIEQLPPQTCVLVSLSYFCASTTLTLHALHSLAHTVREIRDTRIGGPLYVAYMNSTNPLANRNYEILKEALGLDPEAPAVAQQTVEYRKNRKPGGLTSKEDFMSEILCLQRS